MSIWTTTKTALTGLGIAMAANVYYTASSADLPDQYIVYQMISNPAEQHADDLESLRSYRMQVALYSRSGPGATEAAIEAAMLAAGFTRGPARELPYNEKTRHYGLAMDFNFLEER